MKQFYESELADLSTTSRADSSNGGGNNNPESLNSSRASINKKGKGAEKRINNRREMKKDPVEKAKEKLWESIVKETENDDEDESSDEDHEI